MIICVEKIINRTPKGMYVNVVENLKHWIPTNKINGKMSDRNGLFLDIEDEFYAKLMKNLFESNPKNE